MTFVVLTKAFDTSSRDELWEIMTKFGCPARFIVMVLQFHDGMLSTTMENTLNRFLSQLESSKAGYHGH